MKEILLLVYELLEATHATTDCGGDYGYVTDEEGYQSCNGCKHEWDCRNSYQRKQKADELKALIDKMLPSQ